MRARLSLFGKLTLTTVTHNSYFDPKSDANAPTWFMVDVEVRHHFPPPPATKSVQGRADSALQFISRLATFVPLALLQHLATLSHSSLPSQLSSVLTPAHLSAIASSALISRGRLSVQPCSDDFYQAVCLLGENGQGWVEWWESEKGLKKKGKAEEKKVKAKGKVKAKAEEDEAVESVEDEEAEAKSGEGKANAKTEAKEGSDGEEGSKPPARQSQKKKAAVVRNKNKRVKEETNQDDKDQKAKEDGADVTASSADDIARKRPRRGQK